MYLWAGISLPTCICELSESVTTTLPGWQQYSLRGADEQGQLVSSRPSPHSFSFCASEAHVVQNKKLELKSGGHWSWSRENSPLSSQVIRGTGVPRTEHRSTKSWPSTTTLSFRTLENEGATCAKSDPVKANNRRSLSDVAHPPAGWPVIPSLVRQTPNCLGPWASSTAGYASPTSMLGEEKHQTPAVHSIQLTGGLPWLQSSLVLGHTHRGSCLPSFWHRSLPSTFDRCYPEHPGSAFSHLSVF